MHKNQNSPLSIQISKTVRGIPRKIRSRARGITTKIIPVTVITAGFS